MADEADLTFEIWISLPEEIVNTVRFGQNNVTDMFPIRRLIQKYV